MFSCLPCRSAARWFLASLVVATVLQLIGYGLPVIAEYLWSGSAISTLYHWKLPQFDVNDRVLIMVWMWLAAPILEELLFRKVLFTFAAKRVSMGAAVAGVSLLFALLHTEYWANPEYWPHGIVILMSGVVYQLLYMAHGRLWVPIACHIAFNVLAAVPRPPMGPVLNDWGLVGMAPKVLLMGSFLVLGSAVFLATCQWLWTRASLRC